MLHLFIQIMNPENIYVIGFSVKARQNTNQWTNVDSVYIKRYECHRHL